MSFSPGCIITGMASKDFLVSPCIISNVSVCDVIVCDVIVCDVIVCDVIVCDVIVCDVIACDVTLEHVISRYDKIFSIVSLQDAGSSCEIPEDTVLQTFRLSMDKIFPYDLGKSQDIRIMVVFGVHDFLKVGLINGFCVGQSNFKVIQIWRNLYRIYRLFYGHPFFCVFVMNY